MLAHPKTVNLHRHPHPHIVAPDAQLSVGDMHGNAIKLLYFLIYEGVLDIPETEYDELVQIYSKKVTELTRKDLARFKKILHAATILNKKIKIIMLGDLFADRGNNDYFTLKIVELLGKNKIPYEILLSNHDAEFLWMYEGDMQDFYSPRITFDGQTRSLENLGSLLKKGLTNKTELTRIIEHYYLPNLRLIDYQINEHNKTLYLYTHAPVGLETIKDIAKKFNVNFKADCVESLAETIREINQRFTKAVMDKEVCTLCGYGTAHGTVDKNPIVRLIWKRGYEGNVMPKMLGDFQMKYVHGHDGNAIPPRHYEDAVINLDKNNNLGKHFGMNENNKGLYYVLCYRLKSRLAKRKKVKVV